MFRIIVGAFLVSNATPARIRINRGRRPTPLDPMYGSSLSISVAKIQLLSERHRLEAKRCPSPR